MHQKYFLKIKISFASWIVLCVREKSIKIAWAYITTHVPKVCWFKINKLFALFLPKFGGLKMAFGVRISKKSELGDWRTNTFLPSDMFRLPKKVLISFVRGAKVAFFPYVCTVNKLKLPRRLTGWNTPSYIYPGIAV